MLFKHVPTGYKDSHQLAVWAVFERNQNECDNCERMREQSLKAADKEHSEYIRIRALSSTRDIDLYHKQKAVCQLAEMS